MSESKKTVYERVTETLIARMEAGVNPWKRPWDPSTGAATVNRNPVTGTVYRGINAILTGCAGFSSPYWLTYKQLTAKGGSVRGQSGTLITYWERGTRKGEEGEDPETYAFLKHYHVFNLDQIDGITPEALGIDATPATPRPAFNPIESAERIVQGFAGCPEIVHKGTRACYAPSMDLVAMPPRETFRTPAHYYGTLFHELAHSTGHRSRLNRDSLTKLASFGSHEYSREELVAEMGSAFLLAAAGIDGSDLMDNSAAYLASWIKVLKGDSRLALQAAGAAQKAADHITGTTYAPETKTA
jgi:antirestriction protein ArdC